MVGGGVQDEETGHVGQEARRAKEGQARRQEGVVASVPLGADLRPGLGGHAHLIQGRLLPILECGHATAGEKLRLTSRSGQNGAENHSEREKVFRMTIRKFLNTHFRRLMQDN